MLTPKQIAAALNAEFVIQFRAGMNDASEEHVAQFIAGLSKDPVLVELTKQRDDLSQCVHFALNWLHSKGSGMLMDRSDPTATEWNMEHWTAWFIRTMGTIGVKYDSEILDFQRASQTDRKKMLKANPTLQEKLNKTP